jgi:flavodoxin
MESLIICCSYHHKNTDKVAKVIAKVLDAQIMTPDEIIPERLQSYKLIGFGSGIDSGKHYKPLLEFVDRLLKVNNNKAFVFFQALFQRVKNLKQ